MSERYKVKITTHALADTGDYFTSYELVDTATKAVLFLEGDRDDAGEILQGIAAALNQQAGVVEALRPLEVELEKLDDATERDSTPEMVGATWRLIEAARAAIAAVKVVEP